MRILILGGDGYLGWPTAMYLSKLGCDVAVVDNYFRRDICNQLNIPPLFQTLSLPERVELWRNQTGHTIPCAIGDITDYDFLASCFSGMAFGTDNFQKPDAVIHYAEQPSAPYSMMGRQEAAFTIHNNLISTCNLVHAVHEYAPQCHIIKLGTMGVYGTPNIDIEEGYLDVEHNGRRHTFLYPKTPGSVYHLTKAQDGDMLYFYCRMWDIRVTDLNQGPVYGIFTNESHQDERLATIFNYDSIFGTVLNRFICQAVAGVPLTVYGQGGQARGYLNLKDTLQCVWLAAQNPPTAGTYKVYNQFVETFTVNELAERVQDAGAQLGIQVTVQNIENPRREAEEHYYNPAHTGLLDLGLNPHFLNQETLCEMIELARQHKDHIRPDVLMPNVSWTANKS